MSKFVAYAGIVALAVSGHGCTEAPPVSRAKQTLVDRAQKELGDQPASVRGLKGDVEIVFARPKYRFTLEEAAKGISIEYRIVVHRDVTGIIPFPQDLGATIPGPSGLIPFEDLFGDGHRYCLTDFGLGAGPPTEPRTIKRGSYACSFRWDGRNWSGPSDYDPPRPKGKPFPVGEYTLRVSCKGQQFIDDSKQEFEIEASVPIQLGE